MNHNFGYRKLGMKTSHRMAVLRNLATSLILHERIETTLPRAKELKRLVDKLVTLGKRGDLHARRQAESFVYDKDATKKLFDDVSKRMDGRPGGYTRILQLAPRFGDGSKRAYIELVDYTYNPAKAQED
jgi:large subunit ribosomal protein L17